MTTIASLNNMQSPLSLAARVLLVAVFVVHGVAKITDFPMFVGYIGSKGIPFPEAAAALTAVLEIGGALLLLVGWKARETALVLTVYTVILAFVFHNYWGMPDAQVAAQKAQFFKNLSIAGGFLLLAAWGPGQWSLDERSNASGTSHASPTRA